MEITIDWWQRAVAVPVKRALVAVAARVRPGKDGRGVLVKLREEVQMCGYEDVQVMWEMLQRSAAELARDRRRKKSSSSPESSPCRRVMPSWLRLRSPAARFVPRPARAAQVPPCVEVKVKRIV